MADSDLEALLDNRWRVLGGPDLEPEVRFAQPRRWRFDRAHLASMVAIEAEGGVYSGGRHTRGKGFEDDCEKYNAAAALGWLVFRVTAGMLDRDPAGVLLPIMATIAKRHDAAYKHAG